MFLCNCLIMVSLQVSVRVVSECPMHTEHQVQQAVTKPEISPQAYSGESKPKQRGGKRPGAGRKPNLAKQLLKGLTRDAIALAVQDIDIGAVITSLLKSKRERTKLETLVFLRDTLHGRPAENVQLSSSMVHAHTVWRPLADLTDDEMAFLDKVTKKLSAPAASEASPDGPQNQIESKPAIEAVAMESEA
jgi:hypothetical protein